MSIKTEMQGPSGYLKKVRDQYLPSSRQMAELAYQRYTEQHGFDLTPDYIYQHADDVLKDLLPERGRPSFPTELAPKALQELEVVSLY